jgi:hypothetical protein
MWTVASSRFVLQYNLWLIWQLLWAVAATLPWTYAPTDNTGQILRYHEGNLFFPPDSLYSMNRNNRRYVPQHVDRRYDHNSEVQNIKRVEPKVLRARWENHSTFQSVISKERNLVSLFEDYAIFRFDRKPVGCILQKHWWFIKLHVCGMVFRGTAALVVILLRRWRDVRLQPVRSTRFTSCV